MADDGDPGNILNLFVIILFHGEQEFIIFPAAQCGNTRNDLVLFGQFTGMLIDGDFPLEQFAANPRMLADMQDLRGQSIRNIDHGGWHDPDPKEQVPDVGAGFGP